MVAGADECVEAGRHAAVTIRGRVSARSQFEIGLRANEPSQITRIRGKPLRDSVGRRAHDAGHFPIERSQQRIFRVKLLGIPSQDIDPIYDCAEIPECLHPPLQRPAAPHFKLGNEKTLKKIVRSRLQLSYHAQIIATQPSKASPLAVGSQMSRIRR